MSLQEQQRTTGVTGQRKSGETTVELATGKRFNVKFSKENLSILRSIGRFDPNRRVWKIYWYITSGVAARLKDDQAFYDEARAHNMIVADTYLKRRNLLTVEKLLSEGYIVVVGGYMDKKLYKLIASTSYERKDMNPTMYIRVFAPKPEHFVYPNIESAVKRWVDSVSRYPEVLVDSKALAKRVKEEVAGVKPETVVAKVETINGKPWIVIESPPAELLSVIEKVVAGKKITYNDIIYQNISDHLRSVMEFARSKKLEIVRVKDGKLLYIPLLHDSVATFYNTKYGKVLAIEGAPEEYWKPINVVDESILSHIKEYAKILLFDWWDHGANGAIEMPLNTVEAEIIAGAVALANVRTLVLVPTREYQEFIANELTKYGIDKNVIGFLPDDIDDPRKKIVIGLYRTALQNLNRIAVKFPFHVYVEGHHVAADKTRDILLHSVTRYVLVLTEYFERHDAREKVLEALGIRKAASITYRELAEEGEVPRIIIKLLRLPAVRSDDPYIINYLAAVFEKHKEVSKRASDTATSASVKLESELLDGNKDDEEVREAKQFLARLNQSMLFGGLGDILISVSRSVTGRLRVLKDTVEQIVDVVYRTSDSELSKGRKVLIFTTYVTQAEEIYKKLKSVGHKVELLSGTTPQDERSKIQEKFMKGEIQGLIVTNVLDEVPVELPADVLIIASSRGITHLRQYIQRVRKLVRDVDRSIIVYVVRPIIGSVDLEKSFEAAKKMTASIGNVEPEIRL